jgi:hypothetical protein
MPETPILTPVELTLVEELVSACLRELTEEHERPPDQGGRSLTTERGGGARE